MRMLAVALLMSIASVLAGCKQAPPPGSLASVDIKIGSKTFHLEVADTEDAREYGLMRRDSMPSDHGMIFVFAEEATRSFWMKNTRIPLDILFINRSGNVVSIHQMRPYKLDETRSAGPAKYAIELNQGTAADAGVKVGDKVEIPPGARDREIEGSRWEWDCCLRYS